MNPVEVWDLPTRLFHWVLVGLVAVSLTTGLVGGIDAMQIHMMSGYGILTLILFRLAWGFCGNRYARFGEFMRSPAAAIGYLRALFSSQPQAYLGHNPAAGWMVVAMLGVLLVQAGTGLFTTDDILVEGPLMHLVRDEQARWLTSIHHWNLILVASMISLHLAAVLFYQLVKSSNLTLPMITGRKPVAPGPDETGAVHARSWLAVPIVALATLCVYALVNWL